MRGGIIENLYFRNIEVGEVKEAVVLIDCMYEIKDGKNGNHIPSIRNVYIEDVTSSKSKYAVFLLGVPGEKNISDIYLDDCSFSGVKEQNSIRDVRNLVFSNVKINGTITKHN